MNLKSMCSEEPTRPMTKGPCSTTVVMVVCKRYAAIARELDRQHRADIVYINFSRSEATYCSTSGGDVKCTVNVIKSFLFISCLHYPDSSNYTLRISYLNYFCSVLTMCLINTMQIF